jgi:23S rRNA G2069 N7-methylase RlmK/C1962 C5-methylase RlmI
MAQMIIDRFEGDLVVLEYQQKTYTLPKEVLPAAAREGDVLKLTFKIDAKERERREKEIQDLMEELFE